MTTRFIPPRSTAGGLGTILSIWAHPDDETYLAGGLMADAVDRGQRVVCVSFTAGERGTSDPVAWPPARLGPVRRWEAAAAMAVLGVDDHRILGFPDGALAEHHHRGAAIVGMLLDQIDPDTIVTFGPDGITFHPDHIAVHRWVTDAWHRRGRRARLLYATKTVEHLARYGSLWERAGIYMTDQRISGTPADEVFLHVPLYGRRLDRKLAALGAMVTQTQQLMNAADPETFAMAVAEETFVDAAAPQADQTASRPPSVLRFLRSTARQVAERANVR
jgi:LmbE family N-acetylglucosaminyl deacetylase